MKNKSLMLAMVRILAISMVAALVLMGTAMGEVSREGLVGEWHFDRDAKDSSGNGNEGTIYGATFVDGKFGKALSFDGGNDYVDYESTGIPTGSNARTIEAWVKSSINGPQIVADSGIVLLNQEFGLGYEIGGDDRGIWVDYGLGGCASGVYGSSGQWNYVASTFDGSNIKLYLNGNLIETHDSRCSGATLNTQNNHMQIGTRIDNSWWFNGLIDEVRIYNRALSAVEIKDNYEAGQIVITSSNSGAEVLLDGLSKGIASPTLILSGISPGPHTVQCRLSGYAGNDTSINLAAGSTASVACTLTLAPGSISVTSSPSGAEVYLDGTLKGTAPVMLKDVSPGNHVIWCKKSGYEDLQQSIDVTASETATSACDLKPANATPTLSPTPSPTPAPTPTSTSTGQTTPTPRFNVSSEPQLKVALTSEPASFGPGQASVITVSVTGINGKEISGADVMLSSTGGKFSPISGQTNSFGQFISTFTAPAEGKVTVGARIRKEGFSEGSGEIKIDVNSTTNQTATAIQTSTAAEQTSTSPGVNLSVILAVILILILAAAGFYVWTRGTLQLLAKQQCVPCDGKSTLPIKVQFINILGKVKRQSKELEVEMETTAGKIQNVMIPAGKEFAEAILTSSNECGPVTVTARSGKQKAQVQVSFMSKEAGIEVSITPPQIPADGRSTAAVTLKIRDEKGNYITYLTEKSVNLTTSLGAVTSPVKIPPKSPGGITILTSGQISGTSIVTASMDSVKGEGKIVFIVPTKRFCMHCSTPMLMDTQSCPACAKMPPSGVDTRQCSSCNSVLPQSAKYCDKCGAKQSM